MVSITQPPAMPPLGGNAIKNEEKSRTSELVKASEVINIKPSISVKNEGLLIDTSAKQQSVDELTNSRVVSERNTNRPVVITRDQDGRVKDQVPAKFAVARYVAEAKRGITADNDKVGTDPAAVPLKESKEA